MILKKKNQLNEQKQFIVCRERVEICLDYLIEFNDIYKANGIRKSFETLNSLPINGIPNDLNVIEDDQIIPNVENILIDSGPEIINGDNTTKSDEPYYSFVASENTQPLQVDYIKEKINLPIANATPINEWNTNGMASLLFQKLFPNGKGDPTNKIRIKEISETLAINHLIKVVANNSNGEQYYPIASHPRFKFWFYDRLRRHRSLEQCKIYMQQQKEDANLTIEQLKKLMTTGDSNAYWSRRRSELEATFEQAKTASTFFTFSYPDNHWEDLQKLMPGPLATTFTEKYKKVLNNPHLVDWFFSHKFLTLFDYFQTEQVVPNIITTN